MEVPSQQADPAVAVVDPTVVEIADVPRPAPVARERFSGTFIACSVLAGLALIASFSQPTSLLAVALFGGYAFHLFRGGRDFTAHMADGRVRARAWLAWACVASVALIAGFTWPPALLVALLTGGYALYLFTGGRDVTRQTSDGRSRSIAWLYYSAIAVVCVVLGFSHPASFLGAVVTGAYATYLYRGGRWVLWLW